MCFGFSPLVCDLMGRTLRDDAIPSFSHNNSRETRMSRTPCNHRISISMNNPRKEHTIAYSALVKGIISRSFPHTDTATSSVSHRPHHPRRPMTSRTLLSLPSSLAWLSFVHCFLRTDFHGLDSSSMPSLPGTFLVVSGTGNEASCVSCPVG